jgi:hypothetical protein
MQKRTSCLPVLVEFEYGADKEGYWNYEHMILQLRDCTNVVKTLLPRYDYRFLFDHSCGHDKQRADGLNVRNMFKDYGGKQSKLRDSTIKQEQGCLGPFKCTLQVGGVQTFQFQTGDEGPFCLDPHQREVKRYNVALNGTKNRLKKC